MYGAIAPEEAPPARAVGRRIAKAAGLVAVSVCAVAAAGALPEKRPRLVATGPLERAVAVLQSATYMVDCYTPDHAYVSCKEAYCSPLEDSDSIVTCACRRADGDFQLALDQTNLFLLASQTVVDAVISMAASNPPGLLGDADREDFCTAGRAERLSTAAVPPRLGRGISRASADVSAAASRRTRARGRSVRQPPRALGGIIQSAAAAPPRPVSTDYPRRRRGAAAAIRQRNTRVTSTLPGTALIDGTVCSELGGNCELLSLRPNGSDRRRLEDTHYVIPVCMGAMCYAADVDPACDMACLCLVNPDLPYQNNDGVPEACAPQTTIPDTYTDVALVQELFSDMAAVAAAKPAPQGVCATCQVGDA